MVYNPHIGQWELVLTKDETTPLLFKAAKSKPVEMIQPESLKKTAAAPAKAAVKPKAPAAAPKKATAAAVTKKMGGLKM